MIYDTPRCPPSTRFAELRSVGTTQMMAKVVPMNNQMRGRIGLMNGVSDGTGCAASQELARNGAQGHHRSPQPRQGRNRSAADHRRYGLPCSCVPVGDLSSRRDAPRVAAEAMELVPHLDLLLNNAGAIFPSDRRSADGIELTCALNHLSYFLLTSPVLERLWKTAQARIINVSSCAHESPGRFRNVQRLRIFGKALNLSETEVEGLIVLAGLAPDFETAREHMGGSVSFPDPVEEAGPSRDPSTVSTMAGAGGDEPAIPAFLRAALRRLAFRLLLPALYVVMGGYALSAMGWNDDWMPLAYLMVTSLLVMTQTLVWPDRREDLGDLYWASMFILLACPPSGSLRWGWTSTASTESAIWPEPICLTC